MKSRLKFGRDVKRKEPVLKRWDKGTVINIAEDTIFAGAIGDIAIADSSCLRGDIFSTVPDDKDRPVKGR